MDSHEEWRHWQDEVEKRRMKIRLQQLYDKVRQHMPDIRKSEGEPMQDVSPKRSSRIAAVVRKHKTTIAGGVVSAFVIALCGEFIRRINGKK